MSLLVVGTTALDSIKTPYAENPRLLGGSASHAAVAASFFAPTHLVGAVGEDFPRLPPLRIRDERHRRRARIIIRVAADPILILVSLSLSSSPVCPDPHGPRHHLRDAPRALQAAQHR